MTNEEAAKALELHQKYAGNNIHPDTILWQALTLAITALRTKHSIPAASGDCVINEHDADPLGQQTYENGF
jgi:hypothetical protein